MRRGYAAPLAFACALAGCASPSHANIDLRPEMAATEVQALTERAQADTEAHFALRTRLKLGEVCHRDRSWASNLYTSGTLTTKSTERVGLPPVRKDLSDSAALVRSRQSSEELWANEQLVTIGWRGEPIFSRPLREWQEYPKRSFVGWTPFKHSFFDNSVVRCGRPLALIRQRYVG